MSKDRPLISVIMGVLYHRDDTSLLCRSVSSVLAQTYTDFELLICDDGSSGSARALLDVIAEKDARVHLIRRGNKLNLPDKLNACLSEARGRFIARMDDDDFSYPDRFKKQLEYLDSHPEIAFVGCNISMNRAGISVGLRKLPALPTVRDFYMTQPYIHPTLVFRREVLGDVGGYSEDEACLLCEDYDLLLRLYERGYQGANLQETLFDYSIPATAKGNRKMKHRWNEVRTRWRRFSALGLFPEALPYVIKPVVVGMLPGIALNKIKYSPRGGTPT